MKKTFIAQSTLAVLTIFASSAMAAQNPQYLSKTTASVTLAPRDNLLIATTTINWDTRASDALAVAWIAPKGSYCRSSEFKLSHGNNTTNDVSWAYRTVLHTMANGQKIACSGQWTAKVVNMNTGAVLASAGYNVAPMQNNIASAS